MSALSDTPAPRQAPSRTRPLLWSVRRELWENRAVFVAPLAVASVILFGGVVGVFVGPHSKLTAQTTTTVVQNGSTVTHTAQLASTMTPGQRAALAAIPYDFVALALIVTLFIVAVFFSLGALHNERRDRSVLFWKSLPVSDLTTVISKAIIPLVVLPPVAFAVTLVTQLVMLLLNTGQLAAHGRSVADLWAQAPLVSMPLLVAYALATLTLWWAPVYAWLMLISGWAKRMPFVWALATPLAVCVFELLAFRTHYAWSLLHSRLVDGLAAFTAGGKGKAPIHDLSQIDPMPFLTDPGLWGGLVFAAAALVACIWLRRRSDPV